MRADLELLPGLLVDMGRAENRDSLHTRRQGNRTTYPRPGSFRRADDLAGRLVKHPVIERLEADPDILCVHFGSPNDRPDRPRDVRLLDDGGDDAGTDGAT